MKYQTKPNFLVRYVSKFFCIYDHTFESPPEIIRILWVLVSTFACTIVVEATFKYSPVFINRGVPIVIPSWVASMILTCNALESPFGQPYNLVVGTFICSLLGVILTKLWLLIPANADSLWVCGALSASLASVLMSYSQVVHPAACSAALIPVTNESVRKLGWYYLVVQLLTSVLVIIVSALFANLYAQYPMYWFLPPKLKDDAVQFNDDDIKGKTDIWFAQKKKPAEPSPNDETAVSPLDIDPENRQTKNSGDSDSNEDDNIPEYGPAPVPYTEDDIELRPQPTRFPESDVASLGYSISREPTQEDEEVINMAAISTTRSRMQSIKLQSIKTLNSLKVTASRASLAQAAAKTTYLKRIKTSNASKLRMINLFPSFDLNKSVIISATDYSIPLNMNFSMLEKGLLVSIQRKLFKLELMSQSKRRASRAATLPVLFDIQSYHGNNQNSDINRLG